MIQNQSNCFSRGFYCEEAEWLELNASQGSNRGSGVRGGGYAGIPTRIYLYLYIYIYVRVYIYIYMYLCVCTFAEIFMCVHKYVYITICVYT